MYIFAGLFSVLYLLLAARASLSGCINNSVSRFFFILYCEMTVERVCLSFPLSVSEIFVYIYVQKTVSALLALV